MFGAFRFTNPLSGGLLWKTPWRLSKFQKRRHRLRLRAVDSVVATVDSALAKQGQTLEALERWKAEMPTEAEMLPKDKYTMFDRKAKRYRKGIHSRFSREMDGCEEVVILTMIKSYPSGQEFLSASTLPDTRLDYAKGRRRRGGGPLGREKRTENGVFPSSADDCKTDPRWGGLHVQHLCLSNTTTKLRRISRHALLADISWQHKHRSGKQGLECQCRNRQEARPTRQGQRGGEGGRESRKLLVG